MSFLKLMYITNNVDVALIAEKYGVDRIWVDLETLGKEERQKNLDTVKSKHSIEDIKKISSKLTKSEMLVRVNPINPESKEEIDKVIEAGASIVMLPMWKNSSDVKKFLDFVNHRAKTTLLLETKEAFENLDEVLEQGGFDEIHIGLNDLHLSYGLTFMFELLSNGLVEKICNKIKKYGIPYGFGGIAKLGEGILPAEKIILEHYRLGSTRAILSRSFCNVEKLSSINDVDNIFNENMKTQREYEDKVTKMSQKELIKNKLAIDECVGKIVKQMEEKNGIK
ncbi:aldolase/citrate lyase family protein [Faecalibacillus intestinalis]|uniref:aldolase/citrate lyase family protein n=1 Tax=Faecalibacillus intestinalis TaxID=1982626 RepID=UPI0022E51055|nr:aldolase/citrate lyase family protein [Faecalibacillus intestinalis]